MTDQNNPFNLRVRETEPQPNAQERAAELRQVAKTLRTPQAKREMPAEVLARIASGQKRPTYGAGIFVNHFVIGLFTPVTLCSKLLTGAASTEMIATPLGLICRGCLRIWNNAMDVHNSRNSGGDGTTGEESDVV